MDKTALVADDIELGQRITEGLDRKGIPLVGSMWFYQPEDSEWRLLLATPLVDRKGPRAAYGSIQRALKSIELPLWRISVVSPQEPLIKLLRGAIRTGSAISGVRFTHNTINNVFIEDAYIYRLQ